MEEKTDRPKIEEPTESKRERIRPYYIFPLVIVLVVVIALALMAGRFTSFHRLNFAGQYRSIGRFEKSRIGKPYGDRRLMMGNRGNQVLGAVTKIDGNNLTVKNSAGEQVVTVSSTTSFYNNGVIAKQSDLKTGDIVIISGTPNSSGAISATFVEIK